MVQDQSGSTPVLHSEDADEVTLGRDYAGHREASQSWWQG